MKLKSVLALINSRHEISISWEEKDEQGNVSSRIRNVETSLYGNPTTPIDEKLLEMKVFTMFPAMSNEHVARMPSVTLCIYLK